MKALVTGAAGFLGSHLVDRLLSEGYEVWGLDDLSTGKMSNLDHARSRQFLKLWRGIFWKSVQDPYVELPPVDIVFNFACPASPPAYQKDPIRTMETCVVGTQRMLDYARTNRAVFVQASTSEVYGDPWLSPQNEEYRGNVNSFGPRACYDEGKRAAEALCYDFNKQYGVPVKVARIFNTYGPRMHPNDGRVVSNFIVQALRHEKLTLYGNGEQTRSFCYVDDLIEGFVRLSKTDDDFTGPVNLGNPIEFTMVNLAFKVVSLVKGIPEDSSSISHMLEMRPLPIDDPKQRRPNIDLARSALDWWPEIQLEEGLKRTIEYFRKVV